MNEDLRNGLFVFSFMGGWNAVTWNEIKMEPSINMFVSKNHEQIPPEKWNQPSKYKYHLREMTKVEYNMGINIE
jgi:hypothetical protein